MNNASMRSSRLVGAIAFLVAISAFFALLAWPVGHAHAASLPKASIASVGSGAAGEVKIAAKTVKGAKGYQFVASTTKKFDGASRYDIESATAKKNAVTLRGLKEGKKYFVKVRAYKKKGSYGPWSAVKAVEAKSSGELASAKARAEAYKADADRYKAEAEAYKTDADRYKAEAEAYRTQLERLQGSPGGGEQPGGTGSTGTQPGSTGTQPDGTQTVLIAYDVNGGVLPAGAKTSLSKADGSYELPTPTWVGHIFIGWYDGEGDRVRYASYDEDDEPSQLSFKAMWWNMSDPVEISYGSYGDMVLPQGTKTSLLPSDGSYALPTPERPGYRFDGWVGYEGERVTSVSYSDARFGSDGDEVFASIGVYPEWTRLSVSFVYVDAGRQSQEKTQWDEATQSYLPHKLYEMYITGNEAGLPSVGAGYRGGTVVSVKHDELAADLPLGSITLLDQIDLDWRIRDVAKNQGECVSIDFSKLNTAGVQSIDSMFEGCARLENLDIDGWDTSSLTSMRNAFYGCSSLKSLDLSGWDTGNVTSFYGALAGCSSLTYLDISNWDVSNAFGTYGLDMFASSGGYSSLKEIKVSNLKLGKNIQRMFINMDNVERIVGLDTWDTVRCTDMNDMFMYCRKVKSLDLSKWDTSNVTDLSGMFWECRALESLDISGWNTSGVQDMGNMFVSCAELKSLVTGDGWNVDNASEKPTFPVDMRDETGALHSASSVIPSGAHVFSRAV